MTKIGKKISELRQKKEWTRYRLAKNAGISYSYLTALEENQHSPSLEILERIAVGLEVDLKNLFSDEN